MSKALFLILLLQLAVSAARGQGLCRSVFAGAVAVVAEDPLFAGAEGLTSQLQSLRSSWWTERSFLRESSNIQAELQALKGRLTELRERQDPSLIELFDQWSRFQSFWQSHLRSWEGLPAAKQRDLRPAMEAALALGTRHLVVFLESPNHAKWKIDRLMNILKTHTVNGGQDSLELALFVLTREIQKSYSLWDFAKCRY